MGCRASCGRQPGVAIGQLRARPPRPAQQCGRLTDRFGITWQVVPEALLAMLSDSDQERAGRVAAAMLRMVKLDLAALRAAYNQAQR